MFNIILPKPCKIFAKFLPNLYHMFNIILPKPCEIFAKSLTKI